MKGYEPLIQCPVCLEDWSMTQMQYLVQQPKYRNKVHLTSDVLFNIGQRYGFLGGHVCLLCRIDLHDPEKKKLIELKLALRY